MTDTVTEAVRILRQHIADSKNRERITVTAARLTTVLDAVENSGHTAPAPRAEEVGDEAEWIRSCTAKISDALGGGSELFTRHGDEFRLDIEFVCRRIREQRERMIAALGQAIRAQRKADGIELSARLVEARRDEYVREFGFYDGETGVTEFPGNGDEYVGELEEIIDGIRALASEGNANG